MNTTSDVAAPPRTAGASAPDAPQRGAVRRRPARIALLVGGLVLVILSIPVSVSLGSSGLSLGQVAGAIVARLTGQHPTGAGQVAANVVWDLRLPRAVLGLLVGAALSVSGAVMQGVFRNPLVSPFTLGVSPAAAFGASIAIIGGGSVWVVSGSALLAALGCILLILGLGTIRQMAAVTLVLLGIAFTQLFTAGTSALQFFADEDTLSAIVRWTFGTLNNATWPQVLTVAISLVVALPYFLFESRPLNALAFAGDAAAASMGVNLRWLRTSLVIVAVLISALCVSITGVIGFVGLVGPHIARLIIGADHRYLIPFSAISGGLLLAVSDGLGRTVFAPITIPVGIVVSFIGVPIFVHLIIRGKGVQ